MRPPAFWHKAPDKRGWFAYLLWPISRVANFLTRKRVGRPPEFTANVPVICIGNIHIGGTGKTPAAIAVASALADSGMTVHFVTKGYGGTLKGPVQVDEKTMSAAQTGDEPLLLAAFQPTWIAENRAQGVRAAEQAGADIVVLDDGFQNPSVTKDLSIVVVDAETGFGNGFVFPAGPLREDIRQGLGRADAILSIGEGGAQATFQAALHREGLSSVAHFTGALEPLETGLVWQGLTVLPFAGIGRPQKFFATLRRMGARLVHETALDDHQELSTTLLQRLDAKAKQNNAVLVTTEKDAVRLPKAYRQTVMSLPVRLQIDDIDTMLAPIRTHPKVSERRGG